MIKLSYISVENLITAFNWQVEIPLDNKYEDHHTWYWYKNPHSLLKIQADEKLYFHFVIKGAI